MQPPVFLFVPKESLWDNPKTGQDIKFIQPAIDTEYLLETTTGLAIDSKTNDDGMPNILQVALMANKYSNVFRLSKKPFAVQKIVFIILTPLSYLLGYRPTYIKYHD